MSDNDAQVCAPTYVRDSFVKDLPESLRAMTQPVGACVLPEPVEVGIGPVFQWNPAAAPRAFPVWAREHGVSIQGAGFPDDGLPYSEAVIFAGTWSELEKPRKLRALDADATARALTELGLVPPGQALTGAVLRKGTHEFLNPDLGLLLMTHATGGALRTIDIDIDIDTMPCNDGAEGTQARQTLARLAEHLDARFAAPSDNDDT